MTELLAWGAVFSGVFLGVGIFVHHLYAGYRRMPMREKESMLKTLIVGLLAETGVNVDSHHRRDS